MQAPMSQMGKVMPKSYTQYLFTGFLKTVVSIKIARFENNNVPQPMQVRCGNVE